MTTSTRTPTEHKAIEHKAPSQKTIRRVNELLVERYGARQPLARDPLDGLILIILSQATNDINCDRAFSSLKATFPTWEEVLAAPTAKVVDAIRSGGLANQKAARIKEILRQMQDESPQEVHGEEAHGEKSALNLDWMHAASADECRAYLAKFHGVGPKTIACVLMFFLGKPAFPVDTHVHRVTKRLGWIRPIASAEEAHRVLETLVPDSCKLDLHVNLISHGRAICRAEGNGGPNCGACLIRRFCALGKTRGGDQVALAIEENRKFHGTDFFVTLEK